MRHRNVRHKKSARKDFGDNLLSCASVSSTASMARTATNTLIMTLDTSLRSRHQVDQAEEEDTLLCSSCKALAHTYFANCNGRAVWKHSLLKKSQRALWKRMQRHIAWQFRQSPLTARTSKPVAVLALQQVCRNVRAQQRAAASGLPATNVPGHTCLKKGIWWSKMGVGRSAD